MADSGLKQRKIAAASINDSRLNNDPENNSEKENNTDEGNEEYDADSKEARLTLMEEILLLGLKDREVRKR